MIYMPNKNYINGRAKEYRVKKQLESEGWFCVRSAGSHSIVDIVAIKASPFGNPIMLKKRLIDMATNKNKKICKNCGKEIYQASDGTWYHTEDDYEICNAHKAINPARFFDVATPKVD